MHQIFDLAKYIKLMFNVVIFEQMKMQTLSAPQNDRLNMIFVKYMHINVHILIGSNITT